MFSDFKQINIVLTFFQEFPNFQNFIKVNKRKPESEQLHDKFETEDVFPCQSVRLHVGVLQNGRLLRLHLLQSHLLHGHLHKKQQQSRQVTPKQLQDLN